jgi:glycosyltransferase involved in cell wall biosynthesis
MRLALVSTTALSTPPSAYGGTELVVAELAKGLGQLGHDVTLFATGDSRPRARLRAHFERPVWPPNELAELRHAAFAFHEVAHAANEFDIVHVHHHAALPYHMFVNAPSVLTIHHARVDELVAHYADYRDVAYVAISQRQAELCPEVNFAAVVHHGLHVDNYSPGSGGGGYVAFLGRFAEEKAPHLAIDASLAAKVPICLGGAPHEVSREYFERELQPRFASAAGRVQWRGEVSHSPKIELLGGARALLVPAQWEEPFGLVMIEAMLVGTPVIAFPRGSIPEVVEDGVTGFIVRDMQEMTQRIAEVGRIDRVRCRARARQRFSHLRMARDYEALYRQLAHKYGMIRRTDKVIPLARGTRRAHETVRIGSAPGAEASGRHGSAHESGQGTS